MKEIGNEKKLAITALIIAVLMLTVAFAAMSRTLKINGTSKVDSANWDIHFKSAEMISKKGDAREVAEPVISNDGIDLTLKVGLRKPKDEITYEAIIINEGDIDAEIESIQYPELNEAQAKIIEFVATYQNGDAISKSQELAAKAEKTVKIVIRYKDITDESLLAKEAYDIPLTFKINYIQKGFGSEFDTESVPDDGSRAVLAYTNIFNTVNMTEAPFANSPIGRNEIETITFTKSNVSTRSGNSWDASEAGDGSITGYYTDSNDNGLQEVVIESSSNIYAPADSTGLFGYFSALKEINLNNFKTDDVTNMMLMFTEDKALLNLDVSGFNTSNVLLMDSMFANCTSLTNLDLSSWNTGSVTSMANMFYSSDGMNLKSINLTGFETTKVTSMYRMFSGCNKLETLNLSSFNTESVTRMDSMFENCSMLTTLDLSSFNTENVTRMDSIFAGCTSLASLDVSSFDISSVTTMRSVFKNCTSLESLDLSSFGSSAITNTTSMFENCTSLKSIDLSHFDTTASLYMVSMFANCTSLNELKLNSLSLTSSATVVDTFLNVSNLTVYVKDQTASNSVNNFNIPGATVIVEPIES